MIGQQNCQQNGVPNAGKEVSEFVNEKLYIFLDYPILLIPSDKQLSGQYDKLNITFKYSRIQIQNDGQDSPWEEVGCTEYILYFYFDIKPNNTVVPMFTAGAATFLRQSASKRVRFLRLHWGKFRGKSIAAARGVFHPNWRWPQRGTRADCDGGFARRLPGRHWAWIEPRTGQ
jgi:hypothetical protein